jgi:hypothetical protein
VLGSDQTLRGYVRLGLDLRSRGEVSDSSGPMERGRPHAADPVGADPADWEPRA